MLQSSLDDWRVTPARAIQPHGWLVVCDAQASRVVGHSANLATLLPERDGAFADLALRDLLGSETSHALRNALARVAAAPRPALLPRRPIAGLADCFDFAVHAAGEETLIEIEPAAAPDPDALDRARALIDRLAQADGLDRILTMAARLVFSVLNWDCATVFRFGPDGAARAIARQKRAGWPDSAQEAALLAPFSSRARADHAATGLRLLSDAAAAPVAISGAAPDLAKAYLRAATADERERAARAGFAAALSIPIRVDGALWGLLQAHDREPRRLAMDERAVLELFGDVLSLSAQGALSRRPDVAIRQPQAL